MAGRILDKTITSFEEATGKIEDAIGWIEKAKEYANEFEPGCKAYVDLHLVEQVLRKANRKVHKASNDLCKEIFSGTK
jgi:hypothetical protein|tara:strand:+ start:77 stop:310 length:234 start_codon:yes stop_codon:yes gene_type:complete